ncbi:MAG: molybdopterin-guanine dinucleotide biosynthesis protein MobB [Dehalococcoidia bacterium]|nr:molybdopterin-guanine dinucleotide biosynthesis protein MobB [Dehalococcoidia bacterium]
MGDPVSGAYPGPAVLAVRGPSRAGKTALIEGLIQALAADGIEVAYVKRTHHELDLPAKGSGRVWSRRPAAMVMHAPDRLQVTVAPGDDSTPALLRALPPNIDLALVETHSQQVYPTLLSTLMEPGEGEDVIARWEPLQPPTDAIIRAARSLVPADRELDRALRLATAMHGGRGCPGVILGTRLGLAGLHALGMEAGGGDGLVVTLETDRCAADAVLAVTGCRIGRGTLRFVDHGKVAATFAHAASGRAVRVAARGDLRARAGWACDARERRALQRAAYLSMTDDELFTLADAPVSARDEARGDESPRRRVNCATCGEEVADGREVQVEHGTYCRACLAPREAELEGSRHG